MTAALMELLDEMTPGHDFDKTIPPLIRHLVGDKIADMLGVPPSKFTDDLGRLTLRRQLVVACASSARTSVIPLVSNWFRSLVRPFGRELMQGCSRCQRGGERAAFDIPDHLARKMGTVAVTTPGRLALAQNIDDVLRNIDQIIDWAISAQSHIGYFAVLYQRTTLADSATRSTTPKPSMTTPPWKRSSTSHSLGATSTR